MGTVNVVQKHTHKNFNSKVFLIAGQLLYNIVLVSAKHQHESAIVICMSPHSWTSGKKFFIFFYFSNFLSASCGMWDLKFPDRGIKPRPPALEVWHFNHWTAREVPKQFLFTSACPVIASFIGINSYSSFSKWRSLLNNWNASTYQQ